MSHARTIFRRPARLGALAILGLIGGGFAAAAPRADAQNAGGELIGSFEDGFGEWAYGDKIPSKNVTIRSSTLEGFGTRSVHVDAPGDWYIVSILSNAHQMPGLLTQYDSVVMDFRGQKSPSAERLWSEMQFAVMSNEQDFILSPPMRAPVDGSQVRFAWNFRKAGFSKKLPSDWAGLFICVNSAEATKMEFDGVRLFNGDTPPDAPAASAGGSGGNAGSGSGGGGSAENPAPSTPRVDDEPE